MVPISKPAEDQVGKFVQRKFSGQCVKVYFDGGKNNIGIVGCDLSGQIRFVYGHYSEDYYTNNVAEISAAK